MGCPFGSSSTSAIKRSTPSACASCCRPASSHPHTWLLTREHARSAAAPLLAATLIAASIAWSWVEYWGTPAVALGGWALLAAKTCVATSQAAFGLVFLPVTRGLVTRVRATRLRKVFDCDAAVSYHAWLAGIGAVAGTAHGLFVTVAALVWTAKPAEEQVRLGAPAPLTLGAVASSRPFITGLALVALLGLTYPFATAWPRRAGWLARTRLGRALNSFSNFWAAHHVLYVCFPILLLVHAAPPLPTSALLGGATALQQALGRANKTAILLVPPMALYLLDRCVRAWRSRSSAAPRLLSARLFPGGVLELVLSKPRGFTHSPGQYCHLACPAISAYEWHPFTLTSAPRDPHLTFSIKAAGDWTAALCALVAERGQVYGGRLVPAGMSWEEARAAAERDGGGGGGGGGWLAGGRPASAAAGAARPALDSDDVEATASHGLAKAAGCGATSPRPAMGRGGCAGDSAGSEAGEGRGGVGVGVGGKKGVDHHLHGGDGSGGMQEVEAATANHARQRRWRRRARPPPLPYSFRIDGPWGAPTQDYADHDAVVLLGAGIGVTPMVSVLRSLLHEILHARCPACAHVNGTMLAEHTRVRRVVFTWLLPDVDGLAWFGRALTEIAAADGLGLMDLRIHLTRAGPATVGEEAGGDCGGGRGGHEAAVPKDDDDDDDDAAGRRTFGGRLAALRAAGVVIRSGRPDFEAIIAGAQAGAGPGRSVGVFFCGPSGLVREVRDTCRALNRRRRACGSDGGVCGGGGGGGSDDEDEDEDEDEGCATPRPSSAGSRAAARGGGRGRRGARIVFRSEVFCKNNTAVGERGGGGSAR